MVSSPFRHRYLFVPAIDRSAAKSRKQYESRIQCSAAGSHRLSTELMILTSRPHRVAVALTYSGATGPPSGTGPEATAAPRQIDLRLVWAGAVLSMLARSDQCGTATVTSLPASTTPSPLLTKQNVSVNDGRMLYGHRRRPCGAVRAAAVEPRDRFGHEAVRGRGRRPRVSATGRHRRGEPSGGMIAETDPKADSPAARIMGDRPGELDSVRRIPDALQCDLSTFPWPNLVLDTAPAHRTLRVLSPGMNPEALVVSAARLDDGVVEVETTAEPHRSTATGSSE